MNAETGVQERRAGREESAALTPSEAALAEALAGVEDVLEQLAAGAGLFLGRLHADPEPALPRDPRFGPESPEIAAYMAEHARRSRLDRHRVEQRLDSVEGARLAAVLARLLDRYRASLLDLGERQPDR